MATASSTDENTPPAAARRNWRTTLGYTIAAVVLAYVVVAYVILPFAWKRYAHRHPNFDDNPRLTETKDGHPGDPLNVALIGSAEELQSIMSAAKWFPANPLGLRSDVKIAVDTVLDRPYDEAPVSTLLLFGRKEDFAFERPSGDSPRKRNHVRFWRTPKTTDDGREIWVGSATYDERVGLSHTTGQITHHIAPDVDAERGRLFADLEATRRLADMYKIPKFQTQTSGRNGGGDPWHTDGALWVGEIAASKP